MAESPAATESQGDVSGLQAGPATGPLAQPAGSAVMHLVPSIPYHWRGRWRYDPVTTPWMPASRWVTMPWNGWTEADFPMGGDRTMLSVVLREYLP
jgi:hypothetical protein